MRVAVWPPSGNGATFRLENLKVINYEELWFEFEYTVMGFFDATSVSIEAKYNTQLWAFAFINLFVQTIENVIVVKIVNTTVYMVVSGFVLFMKVRRQIFDFQSETLI